MLLAREGTVARTGTFFKKRHSIVPIEMLQFNRFWVNSTDSVVSAKHAKQSQSSTYRLCHVQLHAIGSRGGPLAVAGTTTRQCKCYNEHNVEALHCSENPSDARAFLGRRPLIGAHNVDLCT